VEAFQCPADPGRRGSLGAGEKRAFPAGPGLASPVRFCGRRAGLGRAWMTLTGRRGVICWKVMLRHSLG